MERTIPSDDKCWMQQVSITMPEIRSATTHRDLVFIFSTPWARTRHYRGTEELPIPTVPAVMITANRTMRMLARPN